MQRSGLALAVLALLLEAPMHPYRMQQMIKERGKDLVVNVGQRSQLYKTIDRLREAGMITVAEVGRDAARPERTSYAITASGARAVTDWTVGMIATPRPEFPDFTAGLAYFMVLGPAGGIAALQTRLAAVQRELAELERETAAATTWLPRISLIENEYQIARLQVDRSWIAALIDDLRTGRLTWTEDELREIARRHSTD